ncbi:hypothetical protein M3Y94_00033500 [Aphelenchoides besseyi]|nr:hypothetical protein M3Y94_00033500 [Aphelenchoides besseyi]
MACDHSTMLELQSLWNVRDPQKLWTLSEETTIGSPFGFAFHPAVEFRLVVGSVNMDVYCKLVADGQLDASNFELFLWTQQRDELQSGSKDDPIGLNEILWLSDDYAEYQIRCKIVYTNQCPFCEDIDNAEV